MHKPPLYQDRAGKYVLLEYYNRESFFIDRNNRSLARKVAAVPADSPSPRRKLALGRVRSLHVGASNHADAVSTLDVLARLGIRKLTQLKLHNWVNNTDSAEQVSIPAMHNLATVVLEGIDPRRLGASMWATITTLKLSRTPPPSTPPHAIHVLDVLAAATSLTVLHLDNLAVAPWDKRTRVRMPAVEDFWLGCVDNASLILAAPLDLPRLDRLRVDFMGNVTLGQLLNVCGSLFHKASTIELYLSDTSDAEIAQLYGLLRTTRILDFRDCLPRLGIGILYHILTKQTTLPHLRLLRLPTNTKADVLADVLINAAAKHFGPEFTLTTGRGRTNNFEVNVSRKMDKRWFLKGNDLQHDDFTEDREKIRFGKWVNVTIDEYIETHYNDCGQINLLLIQKKKVPEVPTTPRQSLDGVRRGDVPATLNPPTSSKDATGVGWCEADATAGTGHRSPRFADGMRLEDNCVSLLTAGRGQLRQGEQILHRLDAYSLEKYIYRIGTLESILHRTKARDGVAPDCTVGLTIDGGEEVGRISTYKIGRFRAVCVHAESLEPLAPVVVGTMAEIISVGDGFKILVLRKPTQDAGFVATLFLDQLTFFQRLARTDSHELRVLSHKPRRPQSTPQLVLYVDQSTQRCQSLIFVRFTPPPKLCGTVKEGRFFLEAGAVVLCHVDVHRTDTPVPDASTAQAPVYRRAFALDATYITRFSRLPSSP
ncbi:hypothetical protein C8R43DRAFT_964558 [Mycena crocata]|nr:hypothetical protein C8R43DRAFT_964558 [Mycena crocata]